MKSWASVAGALVVSVGVLLGEESKRPNVLFIICDDLNTHVSTSGFGPIKTPAFDALAAEGMNFNRAYCQYPVCGPSRASILSGLYPESTGVVSNGVDIRNIRPGTIPMPQQFKEAGYWTGRVGKVFHKADTNPAAAWHDNPDRFENDEMEVERVARQKFEAEHGPITKGKNRKKWRELLPTLATQTRGQQVGYGPTGLTDEQHKDGKNAARVAEWLDLKAHGDKPFFIACGIQKPHVPFLAPDKYFEMYPREKLTVKPVPTDFWDQAPRDAMSKRFLGFGFDLSNEKESLRREYMQAYHACITFIDAQIGKVLDSVKRNGHWENTIIVLTSDHGYHLGEHFMWGKVTLFEDCARVPLLIRVPKGASPQVTSEGAVSQSLVELIDLYPTLGELCGVETPDDLQGQSLVPVLADPGKKPREFAYTVVSRGSKLGHAIRSDRWRYAVWPSGGEELYDLEKDPDEENNLAKNPEYAENMKKMRAGLKKVRSKAASKKR